MPRERINEVLQAAAAIGRRLRQQAIYVIIGQPTVTIIDVRSVGEADALNGPDEVIIGVAEGEVADG